MIKGLNIRLSKQLNLIGSVAFINVILAFVALFKDIFLASYLGTTIYSDAFMLAFFITDMIGNNLIANALGTGSIPIFSKLYIAEDNSRLNKCVIELIRFSLIITILLSIALYLLRNEIVTFLAGGFSSEAIKLCILLFAILIPKIVIYPIVAIFISLIQVHGKFIFSASIPVVYNLFFLLGTAYCYINDIQKAEGVFIISYTLLLALGIVLLLIIYFERNLNKTKAIHSSNIKINSRNVVDIIRLSMPYLLIILLSQSILYFERSVASNFGAGSISGLNYAYRLSQFPIWVFIAAISAVFFPSISKLASSGDHRKAKESLLKVIWVIGVFITPLMLMLFILRTPIITVLFLRNAFDNNSLNITVKIFSTYCFVIIGQSITYICTKYLFAMKNVRTSVTILFLTTFMNYIIDVYSSRYIGLYSFGIGASFSNIVSALILLNCIKINIISILKKHRIKFLKFFLANILLAVLLKLSQVLWNNIYLDINFFFKLAFVSISIVLCGLIYLFTLYRLKAINKGVLYWLQDL